MGFPFRSPPKSYAPEAAATPYQRAQQAWDNRMGAAMHAANGWRAGAMVASGLALLLGAGLVTLSLQSRTYVHVVEVSPEGSVLSVRPAQPDYSPTDAQVSYFLGQFVRLIRAAPADPIVLRENWLEAYHYLTPKAATALNDAARIDNPFAPGARESRSVHVRSIVQRSEKSWQVSWTESIASPGSATSAQILYTGLFSIAVHAPKNADALTKNPLGIFITDFSFSPDASSDASKEIVR
ncbi:MAG: conjugal transfer protein TrbF [Caulobacterales bacterium]